LLDFPDNFLLIAFAPIDVMASSLTKSVAAPVALSFTTFFKLFPVSVFASLMPVGTIFFAPCSANFPSHLIISISKNTNVKYYTSKLLQSHFRIEVEI